MLRRLILWAAFLLAACYSYVPVDPAAIGPGMQVRARLSAPGALRLSEATGEVRRGLEGEVVALQADTLVVAIPVRSPGGSYVAQAGLPPRLDTLQVARVDVAALEEKRFSAGKTALAAGAAGAASAFVVIRLFDLAGGGGGGPDGGSPDAYLAIPLVTVRW